MTQNFANSLKKILEKSKVNFDRENYKLRADYSDGESFEIDLISLKEKNTNSQTSTDNFR